MANCPFQEGGDRRLPKMPVMVGGGGVCKLFI